MCLFICIVGKLLYMEHNHSHSSSQVLEYDGCLQSFAESIDHSISKNNLLKILGVTLTFMFVEAIVGYFANSLALMADAGHMLNDVLSLFLSYFAIRLSMQPPTYHKTFGLRRVEVISGSINGGSLILISGYIIYEAVQRFQHLDSVIIAGDYVFWTALLGLVINFYGIKLLHGTTDGNLNLEGAYHHILADLFGSIAALLAGIAIYFWQWYWMDLLTSIIVSALIFKSGLILFVQATKILMELSPEEVNNDDFVQHIGELDEVIDVHDFHSWKLTGSYFLVTAHIGIKRGCDHSAVLHKLQALAKQFGYQHPTFQLECV